MTNTPAVTSTALSPSITSPVDEHRSPIEYGMQAIAAVLSIVQNADAKTMTYLGLSEDLRTMILDQTYGVRHYNHGNNSLSHVFKNGKKETHIGFSHEYAQKTDIEKIGIAGQQIVNSALYKKNLLNSNTDIVTSIAMVGTYALTDNFSNWITLPLAAAAGVASYVMGTKNFNYNQSVKSCIFRARLENGLSEKPNDVPAKKGIQNNNRFGNFLENNLFNRFVLGHAGEEQTYAICAREKNNAAGEHMKIDYDPVDISKYKIYELSPYI